MRSLTLTLLLLGSISMIAASNCDGVSAWNGNCVTYANGDRVTYNGNLYTNCGCQGTPGSGSCWRLDGPCSVSNTCDTAPLWDATTNFPINGYVRYAGRLFRAYCDNRNKNPQYNQNAWYSVASCNVCEQVYNANHYYADNWRTVMQINGVWKVFRNRWWVGPQCAPGTADVWVQSGQCGCTEVNSFNYDENATIDDGSCVPKIPGCTDDTMFNYNPEANWDDGSCIPIVLGCTDNTMFNYNSDANTDDGSCIPVVLGCTDNTMFNYNAAANTDDGSCIAFCYGCTDPTATNYNAAANSDDGSCTYAVPGCTDPAATNYNPAATVDNGCCEYPAPVSGCTDPNATNYDPAATVDNGCCEYAAPVSGCTDPAATNYDPAATVDNGCCEYPPTQVYGCTDPDASNYNPAANVSVDCCTYNASRPNQGCASPAWSSSATYTPYQVVTRNGRAWRLKDWGQVSGSNYRPGDNVWGHWELYEQCDALQDCCDSTVRTFGSAKHFWVGDCVQQSWNGVSHRFRAQQNVQGTAPRWNCGPAGIWSSEITCN